MAQLLVFLAAVVISVASVAAIAAPPVNAKAGAVNLGYNATFCRGQNFTLAVPGNCSAFYQCQANNLWINYCQYPLLYNHLNGFCDRAQAVNCSRYRVATKGAAQDHSNVAAKSLEKAAQFLGYNATFCRGLSFTIAVTGDCSAFYQCQGNNLWINRCQYPLLYNNINGFCDHAQNVNCYRSKSAEEMSSSKVKPRCEPPKYYCPRHGGFCANPSQVCLN